MAYNRTTWQDSPSTATPVNAARLNNSEQGIVDLDMGKAPLVSPAFAGAPTVPTPASADNSTVIPNTAWVLGRLAALIASAPTGLDTLSELAAAIGNDPAYSTSVSNSLAAKAPLASPAFTGTPTAPTPATTTNSTTVATTAFVKSVISVSGTAVPQAEYTGTAWPARPTATGSVIWYSLKYSNAGQPPGMIDGDGWIYHPDQVI